MENWYVFGLLLVISIFCLFSRSAIISWDSVLIHLSQHIISNGDFDLSSENIRECSEAEVSTRAARWSWAASKRYWNKSCTADRTVACVDGTAYSRGSQMKHASVTQGYEERVSGQEDATRRDMCDSLWEGSTFGVESGWTFRRLLPRWGIGKGEEGIAWIRWTARCLKGPLVFVVVNGTGSEEWLAWFTRTIKNCWMLIDSL